MTFKKNPKDCLKPKYNLVKETYVVWCEHEPDEQQPSSGGLATLENFLKNYESDKLYRDSDDNWIEVQYTFEAATPEEASFIRDLREYGTAYNPIGSSTSCPKCETFFVFEKSSSCCPLCGKVEN